MKLNGWNVIVLVSAALIVLFLVPLSCKEEKVVDNNVDKYRALTPAGLLRDKEAKGLLPYLQEEVLKKSFFTEKNDYSNTISIFPSQNNS